MHSTEPDNRQACAGTGKSRGAGDVPISCGNNFCNRRGLSATTGRGASALCKRVKLAAVTDGDRDFQHETTRQNRTGGDWDGEVAAHLAD